MKLQFRTGSRSGLRETTPTAFWSLSRLRRNTAEDETTIAPSTTTLTITGMKCAGCVQAVENRLHQEVGVLSATVNFVTQGATVSYESFQTTPEQLAVVLTQAGFPTTVLAESDETPRGWLSAAEPDSQRKSVWQLGSAIALVLFSALGHLSQLGHHWLPGTVDIGFHWGLATLALLGPGRSMLVEGWQGLRRGVPTMNTLVGLGAVTAYGASLVALLWPQLGWECFFDAPVMVVGLILLGRTLETQARQRTANSLAALLRLQPKQAHRLDPTQDDGNPQTIPVGQVQMGDRLQVLPGDAFPVDGVLIVGDTLVDAAMLTGEVDWVPKGVGDLVCAGMLNQLNGVQMQATRTGAETTLARIIELVETAQTRKAPIQRLADRVAGVFAYGVMGIAAFTMLFWFLVGTQLWPQVLSHSVGATVHHLASLHPVFPAPGEARTLLSLKLAIAVLVIACPCALGLATPTAILVGTGLGAKQGLLLRGGDVLEQAQRLDTLIFDKTGTLTTGELQVVDSWLRAGEPMGDQDVDLSIGDWVRWAASAELGSRHPYALALVRYAQSLDLSLTPPSHCELVPGCGVFAEVEGLPVQVGHGDWLQVTWTDFPAAATAQAAGQTVIFCRVAGQLLGGFALADTLRPDAHQTLQVLQEMGVKVKVLSGDRPESTTRLLAALPLAPEGIEAGLSPQQKAERIELWQQQGHCVGMVGDGINDAPALAQADVGIALSSGTDVAIDTAQIVLSRGPLGTEPRLMDVCQALQLSRLTFRTIQQNLFWAFAYNILGIPVAAGLLLPSLGIVLSPGAAAALMACSSVSVVTNSLLLSWRWGLAQK
jgi:Cu2+-exporting ATPase